jgi:hypothetical protein
MAYDIIPFSSGCKPPTTGLQEFQPVAELSPADVVAYFRAQPDAANRVLGQSYDKRYSPSTFVEEAVADYLLFSFGKGRLRC